MNKAIDSNYVNLVDAIMRLDKLLEIRDILKEYKAQGFPKSDIDNFPNNLLVENRMKSQDEVLTEKIEDKILETLEHCQWVLLGTARSLVKNRRSPHQSSVCRISAAR